MSNGYLVPVLMFGAWMLLASLAVFGIHQAAHGQPLPHEHGVTVPDWYDPECCNTKDCRPIPYEEVEEVDVGKWLHKPTGLIFKDELLEDDDGIEFNRVRTSQDGRFHVCFTGPHAGTPQFVGYCIYIIRTGV